jgi:polyisoprenoid-binding protein YceI
MVACGGGSQQEAVETTDEQDIPVVEASVIYEVEEGSTLNWRGFKTHVPDDHTGMIRIAGGEINMEGENIVAGSFHVDMNSIVLTDALKDNEEKSKYLIGHLMSEDFFAVDSFPMSTFDITSVEAIESDSVKATHTIRGNLTMRGITKNISFPATVMMHDEKLHIKADTFTIDRTEWKVMFNSESWIGEITAATKEKLIDKMIELDFDLMAQLQS